MDLSTTKRILAALAAGAAIVAASGCAGSKHVASSSTSTDSSTNASVADSSSPAADTSASPSDQVGSTTATDGGAVIDYRAKNPASLGIPIYPGAKNSPNGSLGTSDKTGSGQVVTLTSTDSFDTVYAWYKSQLPAGAEKMKTSIMGVATATFQVGPGDEKSGKFVTVSNTGKGDTIIMLTVGATAAATGASPAADAANGQATGAQHDDLSTFGVPTYPNADESIMLPAMLSDEGKAEHGQLTTKDSFATVYAWYKQRLRAGSENPVAAASTHTTSDGELDALFDVSVDPKYSVLITRGKSDEETTVVFMRLTKVK